MSDKELTAEEIVQKIIDWEWNEMVVEQGDRDKLPQMIREYASIKCKEQKQLCADQFMDRNRDYTIMTTGDFGDLCVNAPEPKI